MTKDGRSILFILLFACISFVACEQQRDPCLQPVTVTLKVGTYQTLDSTVIDTLLLDPLFAAIDFDTSVKTTSFGVKNVNKFVAYLSPKADSCRWILLPDTSASVSTADTITFYYSKKLQFISNACGYTYYYTLNNVNCTKHSIDSFRVNKYDVNDDANVEHLQIYY